MSDFKGNIKIGIALSGGGVRAAAFHLGVLKRLADDNLFERIEMISTVSGGSLVTGLIYHSNNNTWPNSEEFRSICYPFVKRSLTEKNLQSHAILNIFLKPLTLIKGGRAGIISKSIRNCWGIKSKLNDIPSIPRWNINATAIESGKSWRFIPNERMGDYILNYVDSPNIDLSDALCSSAAVPFLIGPYILKTKKYKWYKYVQRTQKQRVDPQFKKLHIWDGGAYDNLGIEPLMKFQEGLEYRKEFNFLIVSDAAMEIATTKRNFWRPVRLIDITMDQVRSLRARTLWNHFQSNKHSGVYFKIGESPNTIRKKYKSTENVNNSILTEQRLSELKTYPTTLSRMKTNDFNDLVEHGYEVANTVLNCRLPEIFTIKNK